MGKARRRIPVIPVAFGIVFGLVVVITVILVLGMNRESDEGAGEPQRMVGTRGHEKGANGVTRVGHEPGTTGVGVDKDGTVMPQEEAATPKTGYTVTGRVVDEKGKGIAEASVLIHVGDESRQTVPVKKVTADAAGNFSARDVPRKDLVLTAAKEGYCFYLPDVEIDGQRPWGCLVRYDAGKDTVTDALLVLLSGGVIAGKVVDSEGEPVAKATVELRPKRGGPTRACTADDAGRFRAVDLVPGAYRVEASAEGFIKVWLYPFVRTDIEDLGIRLPRACFIEGTVVLAASGEPVPGATVYWRMRPSHEEWQSKERLLLDAQTVETDEYGRFKVPVCPGVKTELAAWREEYTCKENLTILVEAGIPAEPVTIELVQGTTVSGIVVDDDTDEPVAGVEVRAYSAGRHELRVTSDGEGRFALAGISPGKNTICATSNEHDLSNPTPGQYGVVVEVSQGEQKSGLELRVVKRPAIAGTVVDSAKKPVARARIGLREESTRGDIMPQRGGRTYSDENGSFVVRQQYPGAIITGLSVSHPEYTNAFVSFELDGVSHGTKEVTVVLEKGGGSIEGYVRDDQGEPKPLAGVSLMETGGTRSFDSVEQKSAMTDGDGRYVLAAVGEGTYRVRVRFGQQEVLSAPVHVAKEEKVEDVNLVIPTLGHIAGRVTDSDGTPIEGLRVYARGVRNSMSAAFIVTGPEGQYRLANLGEGEEYWLYVSLQRRAYVGKTRQTATCSADGVDFVLEPLETGTVSGTVYQKSDGAPVANFSLQIRTMRGPDNIPIFGKNIESEDGSFICEGVEVGTHTIRIHAAGFALFESEPVEVVAGEKLLQVIHLVEKETRTGTIRGTVYRKSEGVPVEKFSLSLMKAGDGSRGPVESYRGKEYRSADGSFLCEDVESGKHKIWIVAEGLPDFKTEPFEVAVDDETVLYIGIGEGGIIRGTVVDGSDSPVAGAVVAVSSSDSWLRISKTRSSRGSFQPAHATTGGTGDFELTGVTPGKVTLTVTHPDYAALEFSRIPVSEEAPTEDVTLRLAKGAAVCGWVKDLDGKLRGNVTVSLRGYYSTLPAIAPKTAPEAQGKTPQKVRLHYFARTRSDHRGEYRFEHVPGGSYNMSVDYLATSLPKFKLEGDEEKEINIDLSETGTVTGTLQVPSDSEEVSFRLYLQGKDEMSNYSKGLSLDGENAFEVQGVFPGTYVFRVSAYWRDREGRLRNPTVTTDPREITVEVTPAEDVEQDITITKIEERE